jgi:pSer/pThr/pTyr-binding forkhead associated (FHA) protein
LLTLTEAFSRCCYCLSANCSLLPAEDNKMCITDLNSTNGTVVNGQELSPMDNIEVEVGSEVIFGEC